MPANKKKNQNIIFARFFNKRAPFTMRRIPAAMPPCQYADADGKACSASRSHCLVNLFFHKNNLLNTKQSHLWLVFYHHLAEYTRKRSRQPAVVPASTSSLEKWAACAPSKVSTKSARCANGGSCLHSHSQRPVDNCDTRQKRTGAVCVLLAPVMKSGRMNGGRLSRSP